MCNVALVRKTKRVQNQATDLLVETIPALITSRFKYRREVGVHPFKDEELISINRIRAVVLKFNDCGMPKALECAQFAVVSNAQNLVLNSPSGKYLDGHEKVQLEKLHVAIWETSATCRQIPPAKRRSRPQ